MIDSFGHSNSQPHLFSEMGYDAFFSPRISQDEKNLRIQEQTLETVWSPEYASGYDMPLLFHISPLHYSYPEGFDIDIRWGKHDPWFVEPWNEVSFEERANKFASEIIEMSFFWKDREFMQELGEDFAYEFPLVYYQIGKQKGMLNAISSTLMQLLNTSMGKFFGEHLISSSKQTCFTARR